jgi:predicted RNase H-like nuclease (RuvC/YqgF family)
MNKEIKNLKVVEKNKNDETEDLKRKLASSQKIIKEFSDTAQQEFLEADKQRKIAEENFSLKEGKALVLETFLKEANSPYKRPVDLKYSPSKKKMMSSMMSSRSFHQDNQSN